MGIKSKIKGSYLYTQWKLGKYTKRRVKTSTAIDWPVETPDYERERQTSYNDNFYSKEKDSYKSPNSRSTPDVKNSSTPRRAHTTHSTPITIMNELVEDRSIQKNKSFSYSSNNENKKSTFNSEEARRKKNNLEKYNRIKLKKSDINDVLVPSRSYTLVQQSDSNSVAYYSADNKKKGKRELVKSFSYTSNAVPTKNI